MLESGGGGQNAQPPRGDGRPVEAQQSPVLGAEQTFALDRGLDPRGG